MLYPPYDFNIIEISDLNIFTDMGEIPRDGFDQWLHDNSRREWSLNSCDHNGVHIQATGEMGPDTYYEYMDRHTVKQDLIDYLIAMRRRVPLTDLTNAFNKLKKSI